MGSDIIVDAIRRDLETYNVPTKQACHRLYSNFLRVNAETKGSKLGCMRVT